MQPEVEPEEAGAAAPASSAPEPNPEIVAQLMSMGFSENGSKRAALATGNSSAEASMEWVFSHMEVHAMAARSLRTYMPLMRAPAQLSGATAAPARAECLPRPFCSPHQQDPDFNSPLPDASAASATAASDTADPVALSSLTAMGFTEEQVSSSVSPSCPKPAHTHTVCSLGSIAWSPDALEGLLRRQRPP